MVKHTQTIRRLVCLTILWGWRLKVIHQLENERLLLPSFYQPTNFTAKCGLVFVLTQEITCS